MSEAIPIAPEPGSLKGGGESFDEEVLTEIEKRLDLEGGEQPLAKGVGEKVELDKADLPLDLGLPEEAEEEAGAAADQPLPKVEVDLASVDLEEGPSPEELAAQKRQRRIKLVGMGMLALTILIGGSLGAWYGLIKPRDKKEEAPRPFFFKGLMPDPEKALRLTLKPFIVPLMKSDKGRILKVVVDLEVNEPSNKETVSEHTRMVRDVIYRLLRDRPAIELLSARSKKLLQSQIKTELNHSLSRSLVFKVLFTEFVITG